MLFGLLDDDTTIYNDPAKAALYGAGLGLMQTQGNTGVDFLRSAIGGAAQGYGAYNQNLMTGDDPEQTKKMLDLQYKMMQIQQMQQEMEQRERERKQRIEEEATKQKRRAQVEEYINQYFPAGEDGTPNQMGDLLRALPPEEAYKELGEMRNELAAGGKGAATTTTTTAALQNLMNQMQLPPAHQAMALEVYNNNPNKADGYTKAVQFLKDTGSLSPQEAQKNKFQTMNLTAYDASVDELPWASPNVKAQAKATARELGPTVADNYLKTQFDLRKQTEPKNQNYEMAAGGKIILKNVLANQQGDGLYYDQNGQRLPGGRMYMPLPGGGVESSAPDDKTKNNLDGSAAAMAHLDMLMIDMPMVFGTQDPETGLFSISEDDPSMKATLLKNILSPEKFSGLATQYIETIMALKDAYSLGALTGPDLDLLQKALADPTDLVSKTTVSSFIAQIRRLRNNLNRTFINAAVKLNHNPNELWNSRYSLNFYNQFMRAPQAAPMGRPGATGTPQAPVAPAAQNAAPAAPVAPSVSAEPPRVKPSLAEQAWRQDQMRRQQMQNPLGR